MTVQVAEVFGGVLMVLAVAGLAVLVILRPDEDGDAGCFVWMVGWMLVIVAVTLFTAAGVK